VRGLERFSGLLEGSRRRPRKSFGQRLGPPAGSRRRTWRDGTGDRRRDPPRASSELILSAASTSTRGRSRGTRRLTPESARRR